MRIFGVLAVIFQQEAFTPLVHAHAGRTQARQQGQNLRRAFCAWLRHYRTKATTKILPVMWVLEGSKMSLDELLSDEPFSYRVTKSGLIQISYKGKIVTNLGKGEFGESTGCSTGDGKSDRPF